MNLYIVLFLALGAAFGLATFTRRHLFSEGPRQADASSQAASLGERAMWVLVCAFLWPIMVLTGVNTALILAKRRRRAALVEH